MDDEILVFNPTATSCLKMTGVRLNRSDLKGLTLGIIDNGKPNFDVLAGHMAKILQEEYGVADIVYKSKASSAVPAAAEVYDELAAQCDLVMTGSGDWGSCTSWSVHDAIEIIRRDVPAVLIVSNVFEGLARGEAEAFGYRQFPLLVFPHPLTVRATEEVHRFAEEKAKELLEECMEGRI